MSENLSRSISVTIPNPTAAQLAIINSLLDSDTATLAKRTRKSAPEKTVSDDEDEDTGTGKETLKSLKKSLKTLKDEAEDESEESDDDAEEDEESDEGEDEDDVDTGDTITFAEVKAAIDRYGDRKPKDMAAVLAGFNVKSTRELKETPKKWEPVYRKVMAKIKLLKKAK